ncbi:DUF167 domain-containing protein [Candidatus Omnitrophota bacterium]
MIIKIRVRPGSSRERIVKEPDGSLKVYVSSPPVDGKANRALKEAISGYFKVKRSRVRIVKGVRSREKTVEII